MVFAQQVTEVLNLSQLFFFFFFQAETLFRFLKDRGENGLVTQVRVVLELLIRLS